MKHALPAALLAVGMMIGAQHAMATEEAKYSVVVKDGSCELRDYESHVVAEVTVEGSLEDAGNNAFGILFSYISGANQVNTNIAMTAPVSQEARSQEIAMTAPVGQHSVTGGWAVSFMMPASFTIETTPVPTDSRVVLRQVQARRVAAIRYSGAWSEKKYLRHKTELESWILAKGLVATGGPEWARYNSPFALWFLRRNEVIIPVRIEKPKTDADNQAQPAGGGSSSAPGQ